MKKIHDYIDYEFILSDAGLLYLVNEYKYDCFTESLDIANEEHEKIDPLLRNFFTINKDLRQINLLSTEEMDIRIRKFIDKHR